MDLEGIKELVEPCGNLKYFLPHMDDERLKQFAHLLMKKDRYISDEMRNYDLIWQMIFQIFYGGKLNLVFELGDFQGLIGFLDIIPGWKCRVMFKIWDKDSWNKDNIRSGRKLIDRIRERLQLIRMETHTADPKMKKLGEMFGFSEEGRMIKSFKWNGEIFDLILLSKVEG